MFDASAIELLERPILGASVLSWLYLASLWTGLSLVFILARRYFAGRFVAFAGRTTNQVDDVVAELLAKTRLYFLVALALYLALVLLNMPDRAVDLIRKVTFVVILMQVIRWGSSLIDLWIARYKEAKLDEDAAAVTTVQAAGFLGRLLLWSVVLLVALDNFGVDVTALVAGLGVGGIAVALAVQNILGDLFASLSIVLDKPFVVGDFLIVGEFLGTVEYIGMKTTRIRSLSGEQIVFSNGDLLNSRIRNYKRMYERRVVFSVGVVYGTPVEQLERIPGMLREAVEAQDTVRFDRAHFKAYGSYDLQFEVVYYVLVPDYNAYMDIQQAVNLAIYRRFEEEGITFAYPTQTLYVERDEEVVAARPPREHAAGSG